MSLFYTKLSISLAAIGLSFLSCKAPQSMGKNALKNSQTLVWEENFNDSIHEKTWTYDIGNGCEIKNCGWGNSELEYYTNRKENARVENGN